MKQSAPCYSWGKDTKESKIKSNKLGPGQYDPKALPHQPKGP